MFSSDSPAKQRQLPQPSQRTNSRRQRFYFLILLSKYVSVGSSETFSSLKSGDISLTLNCYPCSTILSSTAISIALTRLRHRSAARCPKESGRPLSAVSDIFSVCNHTSAPNVEDSVSSLRRPEKVSREIGAPKVEGNVLSRQRCNLCRDINVNTFSGSSSKESYSSIVIICTGIIPSPSLNHLLKFAAHKLESSA